MTKFILFDIINILLERQKSMKFFLLIALFTSSIFAFERYERVPSQELVKDRENNRMWQDTQASAAKRYTWLQAKSMCEQSTEGSFKDWRLPTYGELKQIYDVERVKPAINPVFKNTSIVLSYWSSTRWEANKKVLKTFNYYGGSPDGTFTYDSKENYVRCVRKF